MLKSCKNWNETQVEARTSWADQVAGWLQSRRWRRFTLLATGATERNAYLQVDNAKAAAISLALSNGGYQAGGDCAASNVKLTICPTVTPRSCVTEIIKLLPTIRLNFDDEGDGGSGGGGSYKNCQNAKVWRFLI